MDTFRKWLNKPKADDKSLLARFYHADRALTAIASELDSFDGRAEPDRCTRLVSRLRQGQDKVLSITNVIMQELLGDDRASRGFRVKFPEEVLQENLAGQLWFGAECLAAGSSIINREHESERMRPLAQAVTKSLGNVRNLLREQCLRNNVPNSKTLQLDANDLSTEQLYESLKIFDRLFADFELRYVSAMVQVKTKQEYEMQDLICVLFSETLQRALKIGLLDQDKVDSFDPALMFSIPRLAIIAGLVVYPYGPLDMAMPADELSDMFRPFRTILIEVRNLLRTLNKRELLQLEKLLCTNEDITTTVTLGKSSIEAPSTQSPHVVTRTETQETQSTPDADKISETQSDSTMSSPQSTRHGTSGGSNLSTSNASSRSTLSTSHISSNSMESFATAAFTSEWTEDDNDTEDEVENITTNHYDQDIDEADGDDEDDDVDVDDEEEVTLPNEHDAVSTECAYGYLISNTFFGNLFQTQEVPLTGGFVATNDETFTHTQRELDGLGSNLEDENRPTTSAAITSAMINRLCLANSTSAETMSPSQQLNKLNNGGGAASEDSPNRWCRESSDSCSDTSKHGTKVYIGSSDSSRSNHHHQHHHLRHHHHHHHHHHSNSQHQHHHIHDESRHRHHHRHYHQDHCSWNCYSKPKRRATNKCACDDGGNTDKEVTTAVIADKNSNGMTDDGRKTQPNTCPSDEINTTNVNCKAVVCSRAAERDGRESGMTRGSTTTSRRMKYKSTENLLHRLFVCVAGVADQLQTNFAADLRQILRGVFLMNMTVAQSEVDIPEKTKDSELFEFRASETDVIQESSGSNQSIYSAEEVNPELDNVFNNSNNSARHNSNNSNNGNSPSNTIQHGNATSSLGNMVRSHGERSRSLGDQENGDGIINDVATNNTSLNHSSLRSAVGNSRLSQYRDRNNSVGSNTPSSRSSTPTSMSDGNSPVNQRIRSSLVNNNNNVVDNDDARANGCLQLSPPEWIPDDKAPRCMACHTQFTAFRRRHHCRNCGGVFCGQCSNASAPLPKYGLTKAVRVCRPCYHRELHANNNGQQQQQQTLVSISLHIRNSHSHVHSSTTTTAISGGS